jgi:hypothetical protein
MKTFALAHLSIGNRDAFNFLRFLKLFPSSDIPLPSQNIHLDIQDSEGSFQVEVKKYDRHPHVTSNLAGLVGPVRRCAALAHLVVISRAVKDENNHATPPSIVRRQLFFEAVA